MSKISADTVEAKTTNGDLVLQGNGTGVPDLASGTKLNGTALTDTFSTQSPVGANLIINGDMRIAQRGTSFAGYTTANSGAVTLDRFKYYSTGAETVTISRDTDVPSGQGFTTSLKVDVTTADATVGAGDIVRIETPLEGNNVAHLMFGTANAKQATLSFWVKSPKTGAHYVNFSESSSYARCYPALYTVSVADTWEYKTITLTGDITGTWGTGSGVGLTAGFVLMAGSSFLGTADTWQAASVFAASGVVNCMDNTANNFFLTGVKLELGDTATAFVPDDYSTALAKCQRYFQLFGFGMPASCDLTTNVSIPFHTSVPMRTTSPTFVIENTSFQIRSNNAVRTASSPAVVGATAGDGSGFWKQINGLASLTGGHAGLVYTVNAFSADAEL